MIGDYREVFKKGMEAAIALVEEEKSSAEALNLDELGYRLGVLADSIRGFAADEIWLDVQLLRLLIARV